MAERIVKWFIFGIVILGIFAAGFGSAVLYLWNWLMPPIFGLHTITYWQALGLLMLSWIFFGGQRGWLMPRRQWRHRGWEKLTREEREKLRTSMRGGCGGFSAPAPEPNA
jgi:hypothetical protein